jgi:ligand-binding sensor domain-containing protein
MSPICKLMLFRISGRHFATFIVCAISLVHVAHAQRYTFKEYAQAEGIGNLNISCMLQDRAGFLWLATQGALYRYDGSGFHEFSRSDGLPDNYVVALREDVLGHIWAGTEEGIAYPAGGRFHSVLYRGRPLPVRSGSVLDSSTDGRMFAATTSGLIAFIPQPGGNSWSAQPVFVDGSALHLKTPISVLLAKDGSLFFGCGDRLCQLQKSNFTIWGADRGVAKDRWTQALLDHQGNIWIRGVRHIAVLPRGGQRFLNRDIGNASRKNSFVDLAEDHQGRILVNLDAAVARFENGKWTRFTESNGLGPHPVTSILVDREDSVWLAFFGHGIKRWLGYGEWEHWTHAFLN